MATVVLVLIAMAALGATYWYMTSRRDRGASTIPRGEAEPLVSVRVVTTATNSQSEVVDTGLLMESSGGYVLNAKAPLPLTLEDATREQARALKTLLDRPYLPYEVRDEVTFLFARHNLRCREVDAWIAKARPIYERQIDTQVRSSQEWNNASEPDREDLRAEFEEKALASLEERPANESDAKTLLRGSRVQATIDDELLARFDGNQSTYAAYLDALSRSKAIVSVPPGEESRGPFEQLVKMGLARRGADIPLADLLESLRLKDINAALEGVIEKPIGRKAKAIEFALTVPDFPKRLAKIVSLRELFQVLPPPALDLEKVVEAFEYARATARIFVDTYESGIRNMQSAAPIDGFEDEGWILTSDRCGPACAKLDGKRFRTRPRKLPPFHVGCRSWILRDFGMTDG